MEHTVEIQQSEIGKEGVVKLCGDLSLAHVERMRKLLLEVIDETDVVRLHLAASQAADISLLQLLCAAHRECYCSGKKIVIEKETGISGLLLRAGYTRQRGCLETAKTSCLWDGCAKEEQGKTLKR